MWTDDQTGGIRQLSQKYVYMETTRIGVLLFYCGQ